MNKYRDIFLARRRTFVTLAVLGIAAGIVVLVDMMLLQPKLTGLQNEWFDKRRQLAAAGARDVATVYRDGKNDLATFTAMIPEKREFPRVVSHIFEMAYGNNLKIGTIAYKPVTARAGLLGYGISLDLSGKYAGIKSFIADMQGMKEIVVVESVALSGAAQGEESVNLKLQATIFLRTGGA